MRSLCSYTRQPPVLNEALRHLPAVRLISETGADCGIVTGEQALKRAREIGRDVLQVTGGRGGGGGGGRGGSEGDGRGRDRDNGAGAGAGRGRGSGADGGAGGDGGSDVVTVAAQPPVARIVDYGAMLESRRKKAYDKRKTDKESRKMQRRESALKQVRLSPATDGNDVSVKVRQAKQFLVDGYRVKVFMIFRRGHGPLQNTAKETLISIAKMLSNFGVVQGIPAGGSFDAMFKKGKPDQSSTDGEDSEGGADGAGGGEGDGSEADDQNEGQQPQKRVPLEVLIYPLPRKQRSTMAESDGAK